MSGTNGYIRLDANRGRSRPGWGYPLPPSACVPPSEEDATHADGAPEHASRATCREVGPDRCQAPTAISAWTQTGAEAGPDGDSDAPAGLWQPTARRARGAVGVSGLRVFRDRLGAVAGGPPEGAAARCRAADEPEDSNTDLPAAPAPYRTGAAT